MSASSASYQLADAAVLTAVDMARSSSDDAQLERLARALGHPLRVRILADALADESVCASALARRHNLDLSALSYHVRCLARMGLLTVLRRDRVRGALRTTYQLPRDLRALVARS